MPKPNRIAISATPPKRTTVTCSPNTSTANHPERRPWAIKRRRSSTIWLSSHLPALEDFGACTVADYRANLGPGIRGGYYTRRRPSPRAIRQRGMEWPGVRVCCDPAGQQLDRLDPIAGFLAHLALTDSAVTSSR